MSQLWNLVRWFLCLLWALVAKIFSPRRTRVANTSECASDEDSSEDTDEEPADVDPKEKPAEDTLDDLPPIPWHEAVPELEDGAGLAHANAQPLPQPA